jgi:hypothetical protein
VARKSAVEVVKAESGQIRGEHPAHHPRGTEGGCEHVAADCGRAERSGYSHSARWPMVPERREHPGTRLGEDPNMMAVAGTAFGVVAILAMAIESPKAAAAFGVVAFWLVAHSS